MATDNYSLESCIISLEQAIHAAQHGAHRLEVCARIEIEGMTPEMSLVSDILDNVKIPVRVMIRETEKGFEADEDVLEKMIQSINKFKLLSIDGFVIGILKNNSADKSAMLRIINTCDPFPVTFHKAIDLSADKWSDIQWLNDYPTIDTILTSGGAAKAIDGVEEILKMKSIFKKEIMAGGKITKDQIKEIHDQLKLSWYHGRSVVNGRFG